MSVEGLNCRTDCPCATALPASITTSSPGPGRPVNDATAEELRAEIQRRLNILQKAGILELKPLAATEVL
jgi:hypothetical protein